MVRRREPVELVQRNPVIDNFDRRAKSVAPKMVCNAPAARNDQVRTLVPAGRAHCVHVRYDRHASLTACCAGVNAGRRQVAVNYVRAHVLCDFRNAPGRSQVQLASNRGKLHGDPQPAAELLKLREARRHTNENVVPSCPKRCAEVRAEALGAGESVRRDNLEYAQWVSATSIPGSAFAGRRDGSFTHFRSGRILTLTGGYPNLVGRGEKDCQ